VSHKIYKEGILKLIYKENDSESGQTKWVIITDKFIGIFHNSLAEGPEFILNIDAGFKIFIESDKPDRFFKIENQ
jgi:hypothetical protein